MSLEDELFIVIPLIHSQVLKAMCHHVSCGVRSDLSSIENSGRGAF